MKKSSKVVMGTMNCWLLLSFSSLSISVSTVNLYSSCNSLIDGLHYIKPLPTGTIIPVICSHGYTMIDPSLNFDSIASYLSSHDYSRRSSNIFSSELNDFVNFRQWWLPSDDNTLFTVSPQCNECDLDAINTAYYMSNFYFCFKTLPNNECDSDDVSLSIYCNSCDDTENDEVDWTNCYGIRLSVDHLIDTDHNKCVSQTIMARPSMVTDRTFCSCYKPMNEDIVYEVRMNELPTVSLSVQLRDNLPFIDPDIIFNEYSDDDNEPSVYYLTNDNFLSGTYRIQNPGEYVLSEDILLNFNAPAEHLMDAYWSPNDYDIDDLYWWPNTQQVNDGIYPGMYDFHGLYTLGFFAAITVETNDVIINLNGFSISMSKSFYLQQRFFSIIELSDRNFVAAQGPANLGLDEAFYANNVVIKDGTIGLSSHHGIHGNNARNIIIQNVVIRGFDVAGIALNGCNEIQILDSVIGPQNDDIPVLGRYTHARAILPRLKQFVDDFGDETIQFYDRNAESISQLADRLVAQMDLVYFYVMNNEIGMESMESMESMEDEWHAAHKLFINNNGWMDAGSSYGVVLNGEGAATVSIGARTANTNNITLDNVEIKGIYNGAIEKVKTVSIHDDDGAMRGILSDPIDWEAVVDDINDPMHATYIGDAYTDIVFAMNKIQKESDWYFLHCMRITEDIERFVFDGDSTQFISNAIDIECNTDIQMHSIKGAIGLRIDGVQNMNMNNIYIHDVINYGALGTNICGEYDISTISKEDKDIQYGYTGNQARGLVVDYVTGVFEDITVETIDSHYGSSWGIVIYKQSDVVLKGITYLNDIHAGSQLAMSEYDISSITLPNSIPKACSVEVSADANVDYVENDIFGTSVIGYDACAEDVQIGECSNCYIISDHVHASWVNLFPFLLIIVFLLCCAGYNRCSNMFKHISIEDETTPLLA